MDSKASLSTPSSRGAVLVIGRFNLEAFAFHIAETLEAMGIDVIRFETGIRHNSRAGRVAKRVAQARTASRELLRKIPYVRRLSTKRMLDAVRRRRVQLSIVCHDFLLPHEVAMLRDATAAPAVLWFPDALSNFTTTYFLNAHYDALFFKDPYVVDALRRNLDRPTYYLPECCNPRRHRPVALAAADRERYGCEIATAGNLYAYRASLFESVADYNVRIWGNPPPLWMDVSRIAPMIQGKFVADEEKARAFGAAAIVLNNLHPAEVWGVNARAFEIPAVGGFQLVDWRPGLGQLFEDGTELVTFRDRKELRDRIDYYLSRPEERRAIAERGRVRAHRDHTYDARLRVLLDTVNGLASGFELPEIPAPWSGSRCASP